MDIQKELKKWAEKTINVYNPMAQRTGLGYYTQSVLDRKSLNPDLLILGINPGAAGGSIMTAKELLQGNPCFKGKNDKEIIDIYFNNYDAQKRRYGWDLMKKIRKMLGYANNCTLDNLDKFVLSNMVFFGTDKQGQIPEEIDQDVCAKQTIGLIDILKPKVVLLLGDQSRDLFIKNASITHMEELIPGYHDFYCFYKGYHVIAIYHTAYFGFYSNDRMKVVGNIIAYALDNPSNSIDKKQLESFLSENVNNALKTKQTTEGKVKAGEKLKEKELFKLFKAMINPNESDSCKLFYRGKLLNFEYYTKIQANGGYINSKDTIAIDFLIEGGEYIIRVGTRRNDPEKTKLIAMAIDKEFKPGNTDVTAAHWHVHTKKPLDTSNDEMVRIMNELLAKVRAYRDKNFSIK